MKEMCFKSVKRFLVAVLFFLNFVILQGKELRLVSDKGTVRVIEVTLFYCPQMRQKAGWTTCQLSPGEKEKTFLLFPPLHTSSSPIKRQ